jgi:quinol monooxygenase YgiN
MTEMALVATVVAKAEHRETVYNALASLVEPTRLEEGCLEYHLHRTLDDPDTFVFYERWQSEAHLQRHLESPHYLTAQEKMTGCIAAKKLQKLSRLP